MASAAQKVLAVCVSVADKVEEWDPSKRPTASEAQAALVLSHNQPMMSCGCRYPCGGSSLRAWSAVSLLELKSLP